MRNSGTELLIYGFILILMLVICSGIMGYGHSNYTGPATIESVGVGSSGDMKWRTLKIIPDGQTETIEITDYYVYSIDIPSTGDKYYFDKGQIGRKISGRK